MHLTRLGRAAGLLPLLALAAAACGSQPGSDNPAVAASTSPGAASASPSDPATSPSPSVSPTPVQNLSGAPACQVGNLAVKLASSQGAAGHILDVFTLTNNGPACALDGYPALTLLGSGGQAVPETYSHGADMAFPAESPKPVHLAPGETASFSVGFADVPSGSQSSCASATAVKVVPPGNSASATVSATLAPCGTIDVSPVVAGSNGA